MGKGKGDYGIDNVCISEMHVTLFPYTNADKMKGGGGALAHIPVAIACELFGLLSDFGCWSWTGDMVETWQKVQTVGSNGTFKMV